MSRPYDMTKRARMAAKTSERIVDSTEALLAGGPVSEVTLHAIADGAGVSVQTVLRHFGFRDGCIDAVHRRVASRVEAQRGSAAPGDVAGALAGLLDHYEGDGLLILNLLAQESVEPTAEEAVKVGRAYHRSWVKRCFGPLIPEGDDEAVDALVAATDLYLWKLLRLDLGRSREATEAIIRRLVRSLLESP